MPVTESSHLLANRVAKKQSALTCSRLFHIVVTVLPAITICLLIVWLYVTSRHSAKALGFYYITMYGLIALLNYVVQFMFACLDRHHVNHIDHNPEKRERLTLAAQVVGYREDAVYFRDCLLSVQRTEYHALRRIIVVIDGSDVEDEYMARICQDVFQQSCKLIRLPQRMSPDAPLTSDQMMKELIDPFTQYQTLCILQPHCGKRHAIYTATRISMRYGYDCIFNTDSDTVMRPDCMAKLMDTLQSDPKVAAVAGALEIFNAHESVLARMSHARYFHAFNVERAAQSFHGCVQCISGPCGLYRTSVVADILDPWLQQSFLGKPCAAGDDRHLTACILATGNKIKFSHLAIASTETPITFVRWLKQQTRWMKSALREGGYSLTHVLHKQSWYATFELTFHTLYPFALIATIVLMVCHKHTAWSALGLLVASMSIPTVRAFACFCLMEHRPDLFWIALYGPLYMGSLLPAKLYALATLTDVAWGTSVRKAGSVGDKCDGVILAVIAWNIGLLAGFAYKIYM
jgi:hyaluronan synthase